MRPLGLTVRDPYRAPEYPGDVLFEIVRESRRLTRIGYAVSLAIVGVGLAWEFAAPSLAAAWVGIALLVIALPAGSLAAYLLARRRVWPARQIAMRSAETNMRLWREIDGGTPPMTPEEGLERVAGRSDEAGTSTRIGRLLEIALRYGRLDRARVDAELERWQPTDPVDLARRSRLAAIVAYVDGTDDLSAARAAVDAIPDPTARDDQAVSVALEEARRLVIAGRDPFPPLLAVQARIARIDTPLVRALMPSRRQRIARIAVLSVFALVVIYGVWAVIILGLHVAS